MGLQTVGTGVSNNHHDILKIGLQSGLVWTCKDHPMFLRYPTFITDPNKNYRHCQAFRFREGLFALHIHLPQSLHQEDLFPSLSIPSKPQVALEAVKSSGGRDALGQQTLAPHQPSLLEAPVP